MERSMEFRSQDHHESMSFNQAPPSMRTSAFSKPTLSPSSSLLLSSRGILASSAGPRNGNCFDLPSSSPSPPPPAAPAAPAAPAPATAMNNNPPSNPITSPTPSPTSKTPTTPPASSSSVKYRECLRNHAASIGGHVVDGCGEFMPGDADAMKCAACGCHRSFHRKESDGGGGGGSDSYYRFSNGGVRRRGGSSSRMPLLLPPPPANPHLVPGSSATESSSEELNASQHQHPSVVPKKRFRTKFTPEQKEKMLAFSERVGWRIQRQDETMVEQFCAEAGVKRQVLKVWMHNNKNTIRKQLHLQQQQQQQQQPPQSHQTQQQQQQQQQQ
ncbi:hypothetical protein J5N97_004228 [Dioscorea zingiberensis]|uniref:ZF-HD dimerization-type domain-containing protein n=1 Tax=Dioscorea zingiberensis TaxID=325984 RepID=A0A9D5D7K9_9LILI|nr:hypothetical protein J5N97_004228 [Dioscorea zingiberensis]